MQSGEMSFWKNVELVSGMEGRFSWAALLFLAVTFVVFHFRPGERSRVRSTLILFALSLVLLLTAAGLLAHGLDQSHWIYRTARGLSFFMLAMAIVNVASVFTFSIALRAVRLEPPEIMQDLIVALIYVTIAIGVLTLSGVNVPGIVATSAVLTAVIGLSLQDSLGNIIGGTFIQAEQMIRVGDWIKVDDIEGRVKATRWRHTSVETRNSDTVVIPNSVLVKARVTVVGRQSGAPLQHRQWVYFQVSLHHPPTNVIETVERALRAEPIPCVAKSPEIHCLLTDMKNGDATFAVRYWLTDLARPDPTDSMIRTRVYMALHRANIPLAVPSQSIIITEEEARRDQLHSREADQRIAALQRIELFRPLTDEEREEIAAKLVAAPFVRGEAITQQGAEAHWLYILTEGEADVRVSHDGVSRKVGSLQGGDYFGEMGLMTGEPRTATVIAQTDVKCYRLGREAFKDILRRRPELVEDISVTLAERRLGLDAAREEASEEGLRERMKTTQKAFLYRMRDYFGLAGTATQKSLSGQKSLQN